MKIQTTRVYSEIADAVAQGYTVVSLQGSSRSSKTYNTLIWLIVYLLSHPRTRLSIVRKTLPALRGSVLVDFREIMTRMGIYDLDAFNKSELIYTFPNGSWVEFFSADNETKLRGRKRDILFINEASELSFIEWQQLKMRTTRLALLDYNPSFSEEHWICNINKDPRTYHSITTYKDNPFLEQTIIDEIESLRAKSSALWSIYGEGKMAQIEGAVFEHWEQVDTFPEWLKGEWLGMDFGYTNDPTAIVRVGYGLNADGIEHLFIDELCYQTRMTSADIADFLKAYKGTKIDAESADPRLIDEIARSGARIYPVRKGAGSIEAGIARMQSMRICVTSRSINVIRELRNYVYAQDKDGKRLNTPISGFDHAIDAVRYVVLTELMNKGHGTFRFRFA